jgi:hypothetical protein
MTPLKAAFQRENRHRAVSSGRFTDESHPISAPSSSEVLPQDRQSSPQQARAKAGEQQIQAFKHGPSLFRKVYGDEPYHQGFATAAA